MLEQPNPTQGSLTPAQTTRRDSARRDLNTARAADLAELDAASLILQVERLRGRLDDMIELVDEISQATPRAPEQPSAPLTGDDLLP